ncbi:pentatricopeptide repeat-containing protein At4g22760 [Populus nigra]|uniref:pentatricopeptide repeat-containing protein At4g22760 n=1 Tax=Populus nigra TaxID=3691 RepID=UPI002B26981B|nr:pentatricopeptide repeat-containing protein At4g22760 [Populus nigra]XP_061982767.1 pentatricopeptide repeat-containing protein At4g22760 [Populus nigra]
MLAAKLTTILNNYLTANQAKQTHACIIINGFNNLEPLLVRQILLSARNKSRRISQYVHSILYHLPHPDSFSWGWAIRYFSQQGQFKEALYLYVQMQRQGLCPSTFAVSSALRAYARTTYKMGGMSIHAESYKYGFSKCVYVQTALVDLYSKLGDMNTAQKVFDELAEKNVVSWNSILSGHLKSGNLLEAQRVFDQISKKDVISWNSMISGYAKIGDMDRACVLFQQMPEKNYSSWNALISGYVNCGDIKSAWRFFDAMPERNSVSWITMIAGYSKCGDVDSASKLFDQIAKKDLLTFNAMISCFAQNSQPRKALWLFSEMLKAYTNIQPDQMTLASVVSACSQLGDLRFASWIESYVNDLGTEIDDQLVTALLDLYAKCGSVDKAFELFHGLNKKDVVAYSAMISGCGINGKVADAIKLFDMMVDAQIHPNLATFTGLLTACNHAGLVKEGYRFFSSMKDHGLVPSTDHYAIMVDLLGRAGRLQDAYELIKSMPMQPHSGVWGALLLACNVHNNVELGEIAAQHCFNLETNATAYYSLLANIYSSAGRWDDVGRLRKLWKEKKLAKLSGCSWTEST